jgi:hypothetical protein
MSETRTPARRRIRSDGPRNPALLGLMVIALTAGMFALAGTTPKGVGAAVDRVAQVPLDQRTFVCDASLPGTGVHRGSAATGVLPAPGGTRPFVLSVDRTAAENAYAAESAGARNWSAWSACPEPQSRWWFLGAGGAAVTHDTVLSVTNPRTGAAVFDVDVYGPGGPVAAPALHGITLPGGATQSFDLAKVAPSVGDLAARVLARRGLVTVAGADAFSPGAIGKEVREWLPSTSLPATSVTLTGLPGKPGGATLVVANATSRDTVARVEVIGAHGTFAPQGIAPLTIAPHSVATLSLVSIFDGSAQALRVSADHKIAASVRTNVGGDISYASGVRPIRGATALAVPAGTRRQLVLSSTGRAGQLDVIGYDARRREALRRTVAVPAGTTVAISLPKGVIALRISMTRGSTIGGVVAVDAHGVMSTVVGSAIGSIRLPVVRPGW